jgi:hypothetical protein
MSSKILKNARNLINPNRTEFYSPCLCPDGKTFSTNCCRRIKTDKMQGAPANPGGSPVLKGAFSLAFSNDFSVTI